MQLPPRTQRASRFLTFALAASTAACAPVIQQSVVQGTPKRSQQPLPNEPTFSVASAVSSAGVSVKLIPGRCVEVTETPLTTATVTTDPTPGITSWLTWGLGAAALGLGGYKYAGAKDHADSCASTDRNCTTRKQEEQGAVGTLVLGAVLAGVGTYIYLSNEHSETKSEERLEKTQGAVGTCPVPANVPVQLRIVGQALDAKTDANGTALLSPTLAQVQSLGATTEGELWVNGQNRGSVSLVPLRDAQGLESLVHPGPVALVGAPLVAEVQLQPGTPVLAQREGAWFEARLLGYEADKLQVHYFGWESSADALLEPAQVRMLAPGEKFPGLAGRETTPAATAPAGTNAPTATSTAAPAPSAVAPTPAITAPAAATTAPAPSGVPTAPSAAPAR